MVQASLKPHSSASSLAPATTLLFDPTKKYLEE
jgi:hypothetical protein